MRGKLCGCYPHRSGKQPCAQPWTIEYLESSVMPRRRRYAQPEEHPDRGGLGSFPPAFHTAWRPVDSACVCKYEGCIAHTPQPLTVPRIVRGLSSSSAFWFSALPGMTCTHKQAGERCCSTFERSGLALPSRQLRYLQPGELSHRPTVALRLHGLFDYLLHLLDRAVFTDELAVPVTKATVGLTLATISFCSPAPGVFRKRHTAGLALLHGSPLRCVHLFFMGIRTVADFFPNEFPRVEQARDVQVRSGEVTLAARIGMYTLTSKYYTTNLRLRSDYVFILLF